MIGTTLAGYRIEGELGRGGMAVVYSAVQLALGRRVALKVIRPGYQADPDSLNRFRREAQALASITHPNVVPIYDAGESAETPYFTMELFDAPTLDAKMSRAGYPGGRLPRPRALGLMADLLSGLAECHARGIVHRDIKPSNIFVHPERGAVLADFGLVKMMGAAPLTAEGETLGTFLYMSPEQTMGENIGPSTDLYTVGLLTFELIAGRPPFPQATPVVMMQMHLNETPPRLRDLVPGVSSELDALVARALLKTGAERHPDAEAMRADLLALPELSAPEATRATGRRSKPIAVRKLSTPVLTPAPRRRRRAPALALAALAALGLAAWGLSRSPAHFVAEGLAVQPSLTGAVVSFRTGEPVTPVLQYWSAGKSPVSTTVAVPAREHRFVLSPLAEGTDHELSITAGGAAPVFRRFRTEQVLVEGLAVVRGLDTAQLTFTTSRPMRPGATYWRADAGDNVGQRQSLRVEGPAGTQHSVVLKELDSEAGYVAVLTFLDADLESSRSGQIAIPSALTIVNEAIEKLRELDGQRLARKMESLAIRIGEGRAARVERVRRTLTADVAALAGIAKKFAPVARLLFSSDRVFLREKVRVYELMAVAGHLDRFLAIEGVPLNTGFAGIDRGPFRLISEEVLASPEVVGLPLPQPPAFMLASAAALPEMFNKIRTVDLTFQLRDAKSISRAEVALEILRLPPPLFFEVRVNQLIGLVVPGRPLAQPVAQESYYHHLDPRLLVDGINHVTIGLRAIPGLTDFESPWIERAQLHLERRR